MILVANRYANDVAYTYPKYFRNDIALAQLNAVSKVLVGIELDVSEVSVDGNIYDKYTCDSGLITSPIPEQRKNVNLTTVLRDLLQIPRITMVWPTDPPFGFRWWAGGLLGTQKILLNNAGAEMYPPGDPCNPYPDNMNIPLVTYDSTDTLGMRVSKDGDPSQNNGSPFLTCNPSLFTLIHELAHAWDWIFDNSGLSVEEREGFAQRIENELRDAMGYKRRKKNTYVIANGFPVNLCRASDTSSPKQDAAPEDSYSWCYIASRAGANLDSLRTLRGILVDRSPLIRNLLIAFFDEYYRFSPQLSALIPEHESREAAQDVDAVLDLWVAIISNEQVPLPEKRSSITLGTFATVGLMVEPIAKFAIFDALEMLTDRISWEAWSARMPTKLRAHGLRRDVNFKNLNNQHEHKFLARLNLDWDGRLDSPSYLPSDIDFEPRGGAIFNRSHRNVFVTMAAPSGGYHSTMLRPGQSCECEDHCIYLSFQPAYAGLNIVNGIPAPWVFRQLAQTESRLV